MNCREHQEFFSDLYDGHLPADRRSDLEAHLASCAECRREYEEFSVSLHALREAKGPAPGDSFVRRVADAARTETERMALFQSTGIRKPTTRRLAAPRRPAWAVPAVAAAAFVAFAVGFLAQKHAGDVRAKELQDEITRLERQRPVTPEKSKPVLTEDIIAAFVREQKLVQEGGAWISEELRDRLNRGQMKVGDAWIDAQKEINRRVAEEMAKGPGAVDPKIAEERVLEQLSLVRRGSWVLPKKLAEALDGGQVIDGSGEPRDLADMVRDKFRELGLVEHDGRWMRPEEKAGLLAARKIENPGASTTALARSLNGLEIGPPLGFRNLTLYPILATGERSVTVTTLVEAVAADKVEITEEINSSALQVRIKNKGDVDLAILAGEILVGGREQRVVARDMIIPAKKDRIVDVFDAEPAADPRAPDKTAFRKDAGQGQLWAPLGLRRQLAEEPGQAGVWASIIAAGGKLSLADLHRDHKPAVNEFRTALLDLKTRHPGLTGLAVAVGDCIASLEVYGSPALLAAHFERVVESAAMEAILTQQRDMVFASDLTAGALSVKRLAESVFSAEQDEEGDSVAVRRNGRFIGRSLQADGEAVRVLLFADGLVAPHPPIDLAVAPKKVEHLLKAYEARLDDKNATPARRSSALREMAMLPGDRARQAVVDRLKTQHRRDAVEALGLRGDPAGVDALIRVLQESRKENQPAVYASAAQAVARLGGEKAAQALLEDLDPKSPVARAAAEQLPGVIAGLKSENALEAAMSQMVHALSRMEVQPETQGGLAWPHRALILATGKSFVRPTDYVIWWNNPKDRAEFLAKLRK